MAVGGGVGKSSLSFKRLRIEVDDCGADEEDEGGEG